MAGDISKKALTKVPLADDKTKAAVKPSTLIVIALASVVAKKAAITYDKAQQAKYNA